VQDALKKVTGVTEVLSVSHSDNKVVLMVDNDKVKLETLISTIEAVEEVDNKPRFTAQLFEE